MDEAAWKRAIDAADIEEEDVKGVEIEGLEIAVYNLKGRFYATDNICTHQQACLSDGFVFDDVIECPLHQGRFHIPTGAAKGAPVHLALRTYPVKVVDGVVFVAIQPAGDGS